RCACRRSRRRYRRRSMSVPARPPRSSAALRPLACGHAVGVLGAPVYTGVSITTIASTAAAVAVALAMARLGPRTRVVPLGVALPGGGLALVGVTPVGVITLLEAIVLGAGVGLATPSLDSIDVRLAVVGVAAAIVEMAIAGAIGERTAALRWAFVVVLAVA